MATAKALPRRIMIRGGFTVGSFRRTCSIISPHDTTPHQPHPHRTSCRRMQQQRHRKGIIGKQVGDVVGGVMSDEIGEKYGKGPGDGSRQRRKYLAIVKDINSLP